MKRPSRRKLILASILGSVSFAGSLFSTASINYELEVTRLDAGLGRRIAFMPDIHYHALGEEHVERALKALEGLDPEAVVIGGDLVDEETRDINGLDNLLKEIDSSERIAVLGNHEYWSGLVEVAVNALRRQGFDVLMDEFLNTSFGRVFGYDWREERVYPEISFDGLVFTHDPNAADSVRGRTLVIAGHTHGGLVIGGLTVLTNSKYNRGHYALKGSRLYVSRGLGQMLHQVRINSRPELVIIE
ncbi:MAG: metallophosphoesterase [Thaumarchaeota archaeon]|nr:metallophosphoesterase [Candidatus Calditenuaceae archaeon]MDW8186436.1 metallophosphoesterase [Nitrososphaerota archaeon]